VLGTEGVKRQMRPIVGSLIERRLTHNLQDKQRMQSPAKHLQIR
jgi:hypothetical protein